MPNGGAGIRVDGVAQRPGTPASSASIIGCVIGGNGADGVTSYAQHLQVLATIGLDATQRYAIPNGGSGVYLGGGSGHSVSGVVAFNGAKGVATDSRVRSVAVGARLFANGALAIDRDNDGPGESDGLPNPPQLLSATYEPALQKMRVIFRPATKQNGPIGPTGREVRYSFYVNREPRSEGQEPAQNDVDGYSPILPRPDGTLEILLARDRRGLWLTATTSIAPCFWEAGCLIQETSEFSEPLKIE